AGTGSTTGSSPPSRIVRLRLVCSSPRCSRWMLSALAGADVASGMALVSSGWSDGKSVERRAQAVGDRGRPAVLAGDADVDEAAVGRWALSAGREQRELVLDARATEVPDAQGDVDRRRILERRVVDTARLDAQPDDRVAVDVEPALADQPGVHRCVEEHVVHDVVDVAVDIVVVPAGRVALDVRKARARQRRQLRERAHPDRLATDAMITTDVAHSSPSSSSASTCHTVRSGISPRSARARTRIRPARTCRSTVVGW